MWVGGRRGARRCGVGGQWTGRVGGGFGRGGSAGVERVEGLGEGGCGEAGLEGEVEGRGEMEGAPNPPVPTPDPTPPFPL